MSKIVATLILDDYERRARKFLWAHPSAWWVKTAPACISALEKYIWREVFLDHDLEDSIYPASGRKGDGMEVVEWLIKKKPSHLKDCVFTIHSMNNRSGPEMVRRLRAAGYTAYYRPYHGDFYSLSGERDNVVEKAHDPNILYMPGAIILNVGEAGISSDAEVEAAVKIIRDYIKAKRLKSAREKPSSKALVEVK